MGALEKHVAECSLVKIAGSLERAVGRGLETVIRKGTPHKARASILAHEYGHAKTLLGASKSARKLRMAGYSYGPLAAALINIKSPAATGVRRAGVQAMGELPRLGEEFLATYHGLKALKKMRRIAPKMYRKARRDLLLAYGTYLSGAGASVGTAAMGLSPKLIVGAQLANLGMHAAMKRGGKDTPMLGYLGRRRLAKLMGQQGLVNAQPLRGKRDPLGGFFLPPGKQGRMKELLLRKQYGHRAVKRLLTEGGVSVPLQTKGEMLGKRGIRERLLDKSYKMQRRTLGDVLRGR